MDQFATEEQQVEAIKRFWKENGLAIIAGAVIGLGGLWSWRYYTDAQLTAKEEASAEYQQAVESLSSTDSNEALSAFVDGTESKGYKSISGFVLAREYVDSNELDKAADLLQNILVAEADSALGAIAAIRLAAVQMQQEDFNAVLATLDNVSADAFMGQALALKGDALTKLGRFDEAKLAYAGALEKAPQNMQVQMKLDNLAIVAGA
jgi:predicted negative regulator of RcsB-dependent stress response